MNWKYFATGVSFLLIAYLIFRSLRRQGLASEKNNWEGPTLTLYVQGWGAFILCTIVGIVFVIKSL